MSQDVVIRARDLRKVYRLYAGQGYKFLDMFGLLGRKPGAFTEHAALDGVDLDVRRGEKVAIIGRNGAGKSTLLKLVTRVTEPSSGTLDVQGKVHALLQIGTGFHPDFTGRENVFAYLAQLGITGAEAGRKYAGIVDFAEIEEYILQPVKTYSTGMAVRLMFSTATAITPELLVLDEVLGVGDAYFAQKSYERMRELCDGSGTTLLLVTHDIYSAVKMCERLIWLDRGRVLMDGEGPLVVKAYEDSVRQQEEVRLRLRKQQKLQASRDAGAGRHVILELRTPENRPLPASVYFSRIELSDGARSLSLPLGDDAFDERRATHLVREGAAWSDRLDWQGRESRAFLNYGSPFHKVAGVFDMDSRANGADPALDRLTVAVDYWCDEPFEVVLNAHAGEDGVHFGSLRGEPGRWRSWQGAVAGTRVGGADVNTTGVHGTGSITVDEIEALDENGLETHHFSHGRPFALRLSYRIHRPDLVERPQLVVAFHRDGIQDVCRLITRELVFDARQTRAGRVRLTLPRLPLGNGTYTVTVMVAREGYYDEAQTQYFSLNPGVYACHSRAFEIVVSDGGVIASGTGVVADGTWVLEAPAQVGGGQSTRP